MGETIVTDVTFTRVSAAAFTSRPFTSTVWPRCEGKSNSEMPISRNRFLP